MQYICNGECMEWNEPALGIVQVPGRHEVGGRGNSGQVNWEGDEGNSHFGSQFVTVVATLRKNMRELLMSIVKYCKDSLLVLYRGCIFRCENCYSEASELYFQTWENCILRFQNCILRLWELCSEVSKLNSQNVRIGFWFQNCILRCENCYKGYYWVALGASGLSAECNW